eukprot:gene10782-9451_t
MFRSALIPAALGGVLCYWQEQCGGDPPGGWALPEHQEFDCGLRSVALEYAAKVLGPARRIGTVHHALNLEACNASAPPPATRVWQPAALPGPAAEVNVYVSPSGSDPSGDGTIGSPFATIAHARDHVQGGCGAGCG